MKKTYPETVSVHTRHLLELIFWARRYCDHRRTFAPSEFNKVYDTILDKAPFLAEMDTHDITLTSNGKFFPYAQDGDYKPETGAFDARKYCAKYERPIQHESA